MKIFKLFLIFILLSICFFVFSDADESDDFSWIYGYINIDPSDDIFHGYKPKFYKISKDYVENLVWNQDIDFFVEDIDKFNLRKNINALPRFPYVLMLYGGYNYNRGIDTGFLFRMDDIANTRVALTLATSFGQNGRFWIHSNVEYPVLLNNRLKLLGTFSFFTSAPQYASWIGMYPGIYMHSDENANNNKLGDALMKSLFNKVWNKLGIYFNKYRDIGFHFVGGVDYRIPFLELNAITVFDFYYDYLHVYDGTHVIGPILEYEELPEQILADEHNFNFNIQVEFRWNKFKQTETIPEGNHLSLKTKFYIPTNIGDLGKEFRFKSLIEEKFNKKLWREFAVKLRLLCGANYNISEDYSGDPYMRGFAKEELTGWFALLANIELLIPIVDVSMLTGPGKKPFINPAKFVIYWSFFLDGGFTIENYSYPLENYYSRTPREKIRNSLIMGNPAGQTYLGNGFFILPAVSVGSGIQIYPFFTHFILRFDVGVNLLKAIMYQTPECIEFVLSFNQMF